ncbi:hypothetical protein JK364_24075 [Streptomyces sp. 110]|uniref:Uncharacterized protein n=1 Tax=Streptomyces endocoffeicus TaxID=2898945 RepID=A0ABS1PSR1_9ACTN|nr:hypothetical protein [Streptomyces endocoffeicus]MBL1115453.1 hypothetical protein [Streptomyces endocoffeicus]
MTASDAQLAAERDQAGRWTDMLGDHQMVAVRQDAVVRIWRCAACDVRVEFWFNAQSRYERRQWVDWKAPDGRTWYTEPGGYSEAPSCPLPSVEVVCLWRRDAQLYDGAKGEVQLAAAMATWCDTHQMAVADCPEPGPYCPGILAHDLEGDGTRVDGKCTGRENSCRCMCPSCCGDTPDVWGARVY